ncbi:MAG TPA: hypothetical protein P5050_01000 [Bacteroidia bacterium]|nr:hypothetical protein [Bacteroidia bacterium]HRS57778.1 hypothetical protein [Bacteroidia bacterium]HRU67281.1 hypothetical protein [Bacteroidia bacterium]
MKQLSREHQAVFNFKTAVCQLRPVTETDVAETEYRDFYDFFTSAISSFIESELNFRQADRASVLEIQSDFETYSTQNGERLNDIGKEYLNNALSSFQSFKSQQTNLPDITSEFQEIVDNYRIDLKNVLLTLEMKGSDIEEISDEINSVLSTLAPGNTGIQLLDYLEDKIEELINVRNQEGRGAETNIAIWKLLAAAVLLCLGAWVVYKCFYSYKLCSKREKSIYNTILAIAMITFGACE